MVFQSDDRRIFSRLPAVQINGFRLSGLRSDARISRAFSRRRFNRARFQRDDSPLRSDLRISFRRDVFHRVSRSLDTIQNLQTDLHLDVLHRLGSFLRRQKHSAVSVHATLSVKVKKWKRRKVKKFD